MSFKLSRLWRKSKKKVKNRQADYLNVPEKVYTPVNELTLGMYVTELDRPWIETNFKFSRV